MTPVDLKISIIAAMARALWAEAWLVFKYNDSIPSDITFDNVPVTPSSAFAHATTLANALEKLNSVTMDTMFAIALYADIRERVLPKNPKSFDELVKLFGYHLVQQSLRVESYWFSEHATFGLKLPSYVKIKASDTQIIQFSVSNN